MIKVDLQERDARFKRTREAMEREQPDALLVAGKGHWWTGRGYLRYFTHFHGQGMDTIERLWFNQKRPWGQTQDWQLEAGMVFSYHPRRDVLPLDDWGASINEDILITDTGAERLSVDWERRWRPLG